MSYQQQQRALKQTLEKGKGDSFLSIQLQMQNAKEKYESLEQQVSHRTVTAPATGIVLVPDNTSSDSSGSDKSNGKVVAGSTVSYQQVLMNIGDMSGLRIQFSVPEVNINEINKGDQAVITGSAFPKVTLHGVITEVAAQASGGGGDGGGLPTFPVEVVVQKVTPEQAKWIRSGMDAQIAITVYKHPHSLTVPVDAIHQKGNQNIVYVYNVQDKTTKPVAVKVGKVLVDKAEILSGLNAGEHIELPKAMAHGQS